MKIDCKGYFQKAKVPSLSSTTIDRQLKNNNNHFISHWSDGKQTNKQTTNENVNYFSSTKKNQDKFFYLFCRLSRCYCSVFYLSIYTAIYTPQMCKLNGRKKIFWKSL